MRTNECVLVDGQAVVTAGRFIRIARLRDEIYVTVGQPKEFIEGVRESGAGADIFAFCQGVHEREPRYQYQRESQSLAVLPLTTYENWVTHQINFKPRNKIRKAQKCGVQTRVVAFSDEFVERIRKVYNESPIRQGRRNSHYGKEFETVKREHATFLERSDFIGAYYQEEMIGFAKVTHSANYSAVMNIVAMISQRDKAPANALIAKAIEVTAGRKSPFLAYGTWSRRGMEEFRVANGFERVEIPRYYVPLTLKGEAALKLGLHRRLLDRVPERLVDIAAGWRSRWNGLVWRRRGTGRAGALNHGKAQ